MAPHSSAAPARAAAGRPPVCLAVRSAVRSGLAGCALAAALAVLPGGGRAWAQAAVAPGTAGAPSAMASASAAPAGQGAVRALAASPAVGTWPLAVQDDTGRRLLLPASPQRIVSLLPSLTETLCVLGACARLVAVDRSSDWPAASLARLPRVGGLEDLQVESIARLAPDLVLASTSGRGLDRLEALGLPVLRLKSDSHEDVRRTLDLLARLLGQPGQGAQRWAAIQQSMDQAAARVPPALRGQTLYFEIGGGPWAAGGSSFIGQTISRLGLANVVPAELGPFPKLNPEFVLRAQPAVVVGVQHEAAALRARPGWAQLPALQRGWQCALPSNQYDALVRPGPRLGEAAGLLADCLAALPGVGAAGTAPAAPPKGRAQ